MAKADDETVSGPAVPTPGAVSAAEPRPDLADVEEVEVRIEKLVTGGEGLARWQGIPLFVPRSAPGDRLRVKITERRPSYGRAEIVEIVEPSPDRREPPCPFFARCGGCDLQHIADRAQVEHKAAAVVETLARLAQVSAPEDLRVIAGDPWGYRLRTQLHTAPAAGAPGGDAGDVDLGAEDAAAGLPAVGYFERGSHDLVAVDRCPILVPELEALLPQLPEILAATWPAAPAPKAAGSGRTPNALPRRLDLAAGDGGGISSAPMIAGLPHGEIEIAAGGFTYQFDARTFFQAHRGLIGDLVAAAVVPDGDPEDWGGETAYDLYSGVGLFSLPLAGRYQRVVAVEGDRMAVRYARRNARRNGVEGVEVVAQAVESWVEELPTDAERVLVDPPRAGIKGRVMKALVDRRPRRITYVSCDAATLARDLYRLVPLYVFESLALLDLFPQSGHMESVVQLRRK